MSTHETILLAGEPKGVRIEGIITGTPKPGTLMMIDVSEAPIQGRLTWEAFSDADGANALVAILLEDALQGRDIDTAYAAGDRAFMYCPIPGEEMQVLLQNQAGTGDAFTRGDKLMVDSGTGKFLASTGQESEPFICMESIAAITADTLIHAIYTGH